MKILDLFSGMGGWSEPWIENNHDVTTLDIESKYKPSICIDIINWYPEEKYDVIMASPPCIEFSRASMPWYEYKEPDMTLLYETIRIIEKCKPKYYIIENVRGAIPYFNLHIGDYVCHRGSRYLWGKFPIMYSKHEYGKWKIPPGPERSALRARIPRSLSYAFYNAVICDVCIQS